MARKEPYRQLLLRYNKERQKKLDYLGRVLQVDPESRDPDD